MRPHLGGRKTVGMLEAHSNGLRFMSRKGEQLDIIYANIKHAFFQPAVRPSRVDCVVLSRGCDKAGGGRVE